MVTEIVMPKLGLIITKGMVKKWLKNEGDRVEAGEPIAIIEAQKTTTTITAPRSGYLLKILVKPGIEVPVGTVIAYIGEPGETIPELPAKAPTPVTPTPQVTPAVPTPVAPPEAPTRVRATPRARALAEREGVDLSLVKGTGPGGIITEEDVLRYIEERKKTKTGLRVKETIPLTPMRKTIAERLTTSLREMAQVTLFREEPVETLVKLKKELEPIIEKETGVKLTYTPMFIKIVAEALKRFPLLNSVLEDDVIKIVEEINIGFAVAVDHGLVVPVVRNADKKSLKTIVVEVNELIRKARDGALTPEDVLYGTFTITNLGMYGIDGFTPVINPPQVAILGIGRIVEKLAFSEGRLVLKPTTVFSLTFDHRVVDGHTAAQFLDVFVKILQNEEELRKVLVG